MVAALKRIKKHGISRFTHEPDKGKEIYNKTAVANQAGWESEP